MTTHQDRNVVRIQGETLKIILQDETLSKVFLMLCNICSLVVGSSITPSQKRDLTAAMRHFAINGKQGYVMAVIATAGDRYMYEQADVSIGILRGSTKVESDVLVNSDIHMTHLFGLTYLLFKHGSATHRRLKQVLKEFIYRTVLTVSIHLYYFIINAFSYRSPFQEVFYTAFMSVISPLLYFFESIFHIEYGQGIFHRVFGEYLNTMSNDVQSREILAVTFSALFDFAVFAVFIFSEIYLFYQTVEYWNGKPHSHEQYLILCSLLFNILHLSRCRSVLQEVWVFTMLDFAVFCLSTNALLLEQ